MSLPNLDPEQGWQGDPNALYNFLSQDLSMNGNINGQNGLENMRQPQSSSLLQNPSGHLLGNLGHPNAIFDQDTLNSLLAGDLTSSNLPQSHGLDLDQLRQNPKPLYGQMGGMENLNGPYGLPLTNLNRMSAESAPSLHMYGNLNRGSLGRANFEAVNQADLNYSHLIRRSAGNLHGNGTQSQIPWDSQRNRSLPRSNISDINIQLNDHQGQADLQRLSAYSRGSDFSRGSDYNRGPSLDQSRNQTNSLPEFSRPQEFPRQAELNEISRGQDFARNQDTCYPWSSDPFTWQNGDINLQNQATSGTFQDPLTLMSPPEGVRTFSGNSLDSNPDFSGKNWENKQVGANSGTHQNNNAERQGNGEEVQKQREKNRNAQKRFRQRQKERMKDSQQQMEALTQQMNRLMQEKAELETRNRILEQVVRLNVEHVDQLQSNKEVLNIEQMMLLENYTEFFSKVKQKPKDSVEDAKKWLLGDLVVKDFQVYIDRIKNLYNQSIANKDQQALEHLNELILLRREHEKQGALFSCFYWAVYCWNVEETKKRPSEVPSMAKWQTLLEDLNLSKEQENEMLNARRRMMTRLNNLVDQRRSIIAQLGLELLQSGSDKLHTCPVVQELRLSLEAERDSVFNFLFTAVDETMTPAQEAYLDIASYPWCPDIWAITTILAQKNKEPHSPIPNLEVSSPVLDPIMPHATAFKLLVTPITAIGIGLRLKRGLAMCKTQQVLPKAAYPLLTQKQLATRTFLDVQCGQWKKFSTRDWQTRCLLADEIVSNALNSNDDGYVSP